MGLVSVKSVKCPTEVGVVLLTILVTTACSGPSRSSGAPGEEVSGGVAAEVLISTADGIIGQIADLVVDRSGAVYAVDRQASEVHIVDTSGGIRSIGRQGTGPGEFSRPQTLARRGDTLFVVDGGNGRLQGLSLSGTPLFTRPLPPGYPPSVGAEGRLVRPTLGMDTTLAVIHAPDLSVIAAVGRSEGAPIDHVSVAQMKQEIREGKVPQIFLNTAEAVIGTDSSTWLYVPARGSVQRFDAVGRELISVTLDEPEFDDMLDRFVSENAKKPPNSFAPLSYIADATVVGGDLWVLLGSSLTGPAAIRVVHRDGRIGRRMEFQSVTGASQVAIDDERGVAYFVEQDAAELVRVPLEGRDAAGLDD